MALTNAGHCFYIKGSDKSRDFGQTLNEREFYSLIGNTNEQDKNSPHIHGIPYDNFFNMLSSTAVPESSSFKLKTIYPGLLIGTGYLHPQTSYFKLKYDNLKILRKNGVNNNIINALKKTGILNNEYVAEEDFISDLYKNAGISDVDIQNKIFKEVTFIKENNDFQMGFYFDWTTGLPVLPGSTVKGVLRDVFPLREKNDEKKIAKSNYLAEKLNTDKSLTLISIEKLENSIFEDKGDVFYDAYVIPEKNVKIFEEDYITPHPSPFSDPTPLRFLKIAPGVTFKFQFKFKESKIDDSIKITPKDKKELFEKILLDFGIGAKRNTGYGVLIRRSK